MWSASYQHSCVPSCLPHVGKWHVGSKAAFDLFPNQLKERIRNERQKRFSEQQRVAHTAATAAAADAPGVSIRQATVLAAADHVCHLQFSAFFSAFMRKGCSLAQMTGLQWTLCQPVPKSANSPLPLMDVELARTKSLSFSLFGVAWVQSSACCGIDSGKLAFVIASVNHRGSPQRTRKGPRRCKPAPSCFRTWQTSIKILVSTFSNSASAGRHTKTLLDVQLHIRPGDRI